MARALTIEQPAQPTSNGKPAPKHTYILNRVPWQLPVGTHAEGIYITLQDGRTVLDAVGGAAVSCIGMGHPEVNKAIKDQVDKVSCTCMPISMVLIYD